MADERLKVPLTRLDKENLEVSGAEKLWRQRQPEGIRVGRDRVARRMAGSGSGVGGGQPRRPTPPAQAGRRPAGLVKRHFSAWAPTGAWT